MLTRSMAAIEPLYRTYHDAVDGRQADAAMASVQNHVGDAFQDLGFAREALPHYQAMQTLVDGLVAAHPDDPDARKLQGLNRLTLGRFYLSRVGDLAVARGYADEALTLARERLAGAPADDGARFGLAETLALGVVVAQAQGQLSRAEELGREEVELRRVLFRSPRGTVATGGALAAAHERQGEILLGLGQVESARQELDASLAIREGLAAQGPDPISGLRDVYRGFVNLGHAHMIHRNEPGPAREYYARAVAGLEHLTTQERNGPVSLELANAQYFLGTALLRLGEVQGSDAAFARCLELRRRVAEEEPGNISTQLDLLLALARCGRVAEADSLAVRLLGEAGQDPRTIPLQVGCGLALCAAASRRQQPDNPARAAAYVERALAALALAEDAGLRDPTSLLLNPDLDPIRQEPAFQQILQRIMKKPGSATPRPPEA